MSRLGTLKRILESSAITLPLAQASSDRIRCQLYSEI